MNKKGKMVGYVLDSCNLVTYSYGGVVFPGRRRTMEMSPKSSINPLKYEAPFVIGNR